MAPEVAFKKEYSKSVDIFALGIVMYILLTTGEHPLYVVSIYYLKPHRKKKITHSNIK